MKIDLPPQLCATVQGDYALIRRTFPYVLLVNLTMAVRFQHRAEAQKALDEHAFDLNRSQYARLEWHPHECPEGILTASNAAEDARPS